MSKQPIGRRNFHSLSLRDLLEARDHYHVHLAHLENVVATAIGRRRFRRSELDAHGNLKPHGAKRSSDSSEKRLDNTISPDWGWPSVLVFVKEWWPDSAFAKCPDQAVPQYLYLPDGRVVPTCVLRMVVDEQPLPPGSDHFNFPSNAIGGGFVVISDVQGREHVGSLGCLVTDGDYTYALTNRHVTGAADREIASILHGAKRPELIGVASPLQLGKADFQTVYPNWPGTNALLNLDAGLIQIDDLTNWTAQVFGIGEIGEPLDLGVDNISLDLVNCQVSAFGAASGRIDGEIAALFYRYKSMAGTDYISDFLIGGRGGRSLMTLPGDSGTLWFFDGVDEHDGANPAAHNGNGRQAKRKANQAADVPRLRPLAMQWGGHVLLDPTSPDRNQFSYALATSLSTVCRLLDVDVIRDWNLGHVQYWGEMGHYSIGLKACGLASQTKLKKLMSKNSALIGFDDPTMKDPSKYKQHSANYSFVPLADVADDVWRNTRKGSHDSGKNDDGNNHFADMDQANPDGDTLLSLTKNKPENVDPQVWRDFYNSLAGNGEHTNAGALPFRVWQMYDLAVKALRDDEDVVSWFCLMGTMAHYVGDACQPLHVSRLHHGIPPIHKGTWQYNVHSVYESTMLDKHATDVVKGLNTRLNGVSVDDDGKRGGQAAAVLVVDLMRSTVAKIPPEKLVKTYNDAGSPSKRLSDMWDKWGEKTMDCMAEGAKTLAMLWERAWAEGEGPDRTLPDEITTDQLEGLYNKSSFAPSMSLELMIEDGVLSTPQPA